METSQDIKEIAVALVKVQGAIGKAKKDSENPHFRSKYADLSAVWDACHAALQAANIAVIQGPGMDENGNVFVDTMLLHPSGQFIKSRVTAKPARLDPQSVGSTITYLRRYGLASMIGVVQEDDDGDAGSDPTKTTTQRSSPKSPEPQNRPKATRGVEGIKQIDSVASGDTADTLIGELALIQNQKALDAWFKKNETIINGLPENLKADVRKEYARLHTQFKELQAA